MKVLFLILGMAVGAGIAFLLNKLITSRIQEKKQAITMTVVTYIVCILIGLGFAAVGSLKFALNNFLDNKIEVVSDMLAQKFPNSNIMEMTIDTNEFKEAIGDIQDKMKSENAGDSLLEKLIFDVFVSQIAGYVDMAESGVDLISSRSSEDGTVTVKTVVYTIKDKALDTVAPFFVILQVLLVIVLLVYTIILVYLKKSSASKNNSLVFGEAGASNKWKIDKTSDTSKNSGVVFGEDRE